MKGRQSYSECKVLGIQTNQALLPGKLSKLGENCVDCVIVYFLTFVLVWVEDSRSYIVLIMTKPSKS